MNDETGSLTSATAVPATRRDHRQVAAVAVTSASILVMIGALKLFVPPSLAPRVNIRWVPELTDAERMDVERKLKVVAGEQIDGTTWAYDLGDPSPEGIGAIVNHPAAADTHHIDRALRAVSDETRLGTTRIRGGLSVWRDAPMMPWLVRLASSLLIVSALWLVTTGRSTITPA